MAKNPVNSTIWLLTKNRENIFKPVGPYTRSQIMNFLQTGRCSDKDFIWEPGFKEWKRLSLIPGIPTHPAHTIEDILIHQERKYQAQKPKSVRYFASFPSYKLKDKYTMFSSP